MLKKIWIWSKSAWKQCNYNAWKPLLITLLIYRVSNLLDAKSPLLQVWRHTKFCFPFTELFNSNHLLKSIRINPWSIIAYFTCSYSNGLLYLGPSHVTIVKIDFFNFEFHSNWKHWTYLEYIQKITWFLRICSYM